MLMSKRKINMKQKMTSLSRRTRRVAGASLLLAVMAAVAFNSLVIVPQAKADNIDAQINALREENRKNQDAVTALQNEAVSYQDAIARLQSQIGSLQGQIDNNTAKQNDLQQKMDLNKIELEKQRSILGENIKMMYVDGAPSTIEMLASSKNLSDFVDKEEYRTSVQTKIQSTLKKIADIQNELRAQKQQVTALLTEQKSQQKTLDNARAEQSKMLAYNQGQQDAYNQKTKDNQSKITSLVAEQLRANMGSGGSALSHDPSNGYYPYANSGFSMSTAPGCVDNDGPDRWGYCTRQCVSYAAWAVERSGRRAPMYYGNARDWVAAAQRDGVPVYTSNPQPGDVAISTAGTWGHAMYVESVSGGQIYVSQYNAALDGQYSTQWRNWSGYYFLRFQ
jgi:peptidoglycan DL-endopeptidase CwlO